MLLTQQATTREGYMTASKTLTAAQRKARTTYRISATTFYATGFATVAANMYASEHTVVGLATGLWAPLALFLSLEVVERVQVKGRSALLRKGAVGVIALIAAWVSYWHLVHLFKAGGADVVAAHSMPLTVDVLMALARSAMVVKPTASLAPSTRRKVAAAPAKQRALKAV